MWTIVASDFPATCENGALGEPDPEPPDRGQLGRAVHAGGHRLGAERLRRLRHREAPRARPRPRARRTPPPGARTAPRAPAGRPGRRGAARRSPGGRPRRCGRRPPAPARAPGRRRRARAAAARPAIRRPDARLGRGRLRQQDRELASGRACDQVGRAQPLAQRSPYDSAVVTGHPPPAGLCASCRHQKVIRNTRGSVFSMCLRSRTDPAYPKYPRLPVLECRGYEPVTLGDDPAGPVPRGAG
jgi:hypothetical protein